MNGHSIKREEVITRLIGIYHQLEEVESLLNSNISQKENWQFHYAANLRNISHRISVLEETDILFEKTIEDNLKGLEYQKKIKLTLGY